MQGVHAGGTRRGYVKGVRGEVHRGGTRRGYAEGGCITVCSWLPLVAPSNHRFSG